MASYANSNYHGSQVFLWLAQFTGIAVDQVNFVISQIAAVVLAYFFRSLLHPTKAGAVTRHTFGLINGLIIGHFCFGTQAIHLAILPTLCYIVIRTQKPQVVQRMVLAVALTYLSSIHLHRLIYDYGSYALDITGPLMVITQKVTSLAFSIHDGLARHESDLTNNQKLYAVHKLPSPLEYFSYTLNFPALMAGPALAYRDYMDFIDGNNLIPTSGVNKLDGNFNSKTVIMEPSPALVVIKKITLAVIFAFMFVKFLPLFPIGRLKEDDFMENTTLTFKFLYIYIATMLVRFKYYFAWLLSDGICNNAGIGFEGYDDQGNAKWDKFSNINILKFEFGLSLRDSIEAWNMGTNRWLRMVVYERTDKYGTVLTYSLSALWHGFYPGYYLTFANGAFFTFASRSVRRNVRGYFTGNSEMKRFYDALTCLTTRLVMSYITFTFVLLEFWPSIRLYLHMYMCLHFLGLAALVIVPRLVPKVAYDTKHTTANAANSSLAHALKQATPLTTSVSSHQD